MRNPASLLPGRLRRRHAGTTAGTSRLLSAPTGCSASADGQLNPPRAADVTLDVKTGERPYAGITADQQSAYQIALLAQTFAPWPAYHPARGTAPDTAPMAVIPVGDPVAVILKKVSDGLQRLDWEALDAARDRESLTYAHTAGAPFHNALLAGWRSPVRPARRHAVAVQRRLEALGYPSFDLAEAADHGAYDAVMRHADRITGTRGTGRWLPAITAGGAG